MRLRNDYEPVVKYQHAVDITNNLQSLIRCSLCGDAEMKMIQSQTSSKALCMHCLHGMTAILEEAARGNPDMTGTVIPVVMEHKPA